MTALWIIERAVKGTNRWKYYCTEEDAAEPEEIARRLATIQSAIHSFRGVQYVRDDETVVERNDNGI